MEKILWSVALPGFGQLLNGKYAKGILLLFLEFLINVQSNFNEAIMLSFQGLTASAVEVTDYQWLMFYPCFYLFAAWDAYRDNRGPRSPCLFLPFVFAAFFLTIGLMYSNLEIMGILFGPVWLPMIGLIPGVGIGLLLKWILERRLQKKGHFEG